MSIRNLDKIFQARRIAIIGASQNPTSVGYTVLHNLIGSGYEGVVYPVNPKYESVQGIQAYKTVRQTPNVADLAVICTPAKSVPGLVRECGEAGIRGLVILSAGFREIGPDGAALEQELLAEAARFDDLRIIGPNCLGIIAPGLHLNASFAAGTPLAGNLAFVSQSGACARRCLIGRWTRTSAFRSSCRSATCSTSTSAT